MKWEEGHHSSLNHASLPVYFRKFLIVDGRCFAKAPKPSPQLAAPYMIANRFWRSSGPCVRGSFRWWTGKRLFSLNANNDYVVSKQDYEAFHRDGYVTLKNVMTEEEMQQIERVYDEFNEGKEME